ncbi:MAG TPA: glycoside hydrolase, partial [Firmicutes bacterium]|nr:glycoside hydrolase [Bacillota bacterium]
MKKLAIAFIWNQHQPFYQDTEKKEYIMPWTRLHASKDYYSMAALLERFPFIRQTFNLTPSLLEQIEDYLSGSRDYYQKTVMPAEQLSPVEQSFLLRHYFDIHWDKVISSYPRYRQLLELQGRVREPGEVEQATRRYKPCDYQDLMVWFNLCWIDPLIRQGNPFLQELERAGQDFSWDDCRQLMEQQLDILRQVVPVHRRLQDKGQIEVITTPFYHPIMPLIIDSHSALRSCPELPLPP